MQKKLLCLFTVVMISLSACSQAVSPMAPSQVISAEQQTLLTPPMDTPAPIASVTPVAATLGGGEYWAASINREADGRFSIFIVQPLAEATPETIFRTESGDTPYSLHWSPDGQYLFFTVYRGEGRKVQAFYLYDRVNRLLQSFDFQQMTGRQGVVDNPDWSPDVQSRQLGFSLCADMFKDCTLWLADFTQGTAVQLKDQGEDWIWDTVGESMLFEKQMLNAPVRFYLETLTEQELPGLSFSKLNPDGGNWRLYGYFPNLNGYLISRPNTDDTWDFYLLSETGSQETFLFQAPQGWSSELIQPPLLSPDGKQVGFNFYSFEEEPTVVIGSLEQLPLQVPATPDPQRGLLLLWSPDNSIYVTLAAIEGVTNPASMAFYDAQSGSLLKTYQPPAPFEMALWPGSSSFGNLQRHYFYGFDSVWIR